MRIWLYMISLAFLLIGCTNSKFEQSKDQGVPGTKLSVNSQFGKLQKYPTVKYIQLDDRKYVSVQEFSKALGYKYAFDNINRTLYLNDGQVEYKFIYNVPVYNKGPEHLPTERHTFEIVEDHPFISSAFIEKTLKIQVHQNRDRLALKIKKRELEVPVTAEIETPKTVEDIISMMSILDKPIKGASVSTVSSHLPGAKRTYRHGTHEGMDFYQYSSSITINKSTPVFGMAEGKVVRADHDYIPYHSEEVRNKDLQIAATYPNTPEYMLDKLRGKQVWVAYPNGILARYAHLDSIPASVQVGDSITKDTVIGYVGNSGTSGEVKRDNSELHLHLDILIHNELFWKGMTSEQVKYVLNSVFEK